MITLITGGARSGKSTLAERMAAIRATPVTYFATAEVYDPDMEQRVQLHRDRRPAGWTTIEVGADLAPAVRECEGLAIIECLGTWVSRFADFEVDGQELIESMTARSGDTIVVTNEVGMGVHPYTDVGRRFRDTLGNLNRAVADHADEVLLVVSGRVLRLDRP